MYFLGSAADCHRPACRLLLVRCAAMKNGAQKQFDQGRQSGLTSPRKGLNVRWTGLILEDSAAGREHRRRWVDRLRSPHNSEQARARYPRRCHHRHHRVPQQQLEQRRGVERRPDRRHPGQHAADAVLPFTDDQGVVASNRSRTTGPWPPARTVSSVSGTGRPPATTGRRADSQRRARRSAP